MQLPSLSDLAIPAGLLGLGLAGGLAALALDAPLPFLLGSLIATAGFAIWRSIRGGGTLDFPQVLRKTFVAIIGVKIGASFSPEILGILPTLWLSMLGMVAFAALAQLIGYTLYRRVGGYDRTTALFAAAPGGLIEAVALGEAAGGDPRVLTIQHFTRIVLVVVSVPFLFFAWSGTTVGSAAGETLGEGPARVFDLTMIGVLAVAGLVLGGRLRMPAAHLLGPLLLSAIVHGTGLVTLQSPAWLLNTAQIVVGTGLGMMFAGAEPRLLARAVVLGGLTLGLMLGLAIAFAFGLAALTPLAVETLFVSFAPGGVTEMSLIALSLQTNPVIVTAHHVFRIVLTATALGVVARRLGVRD
ncbi:MAG: AbrB family transcriptional regulator [Pseudomonadota bacterium]